MIEDGSDYHRLELSIARDPADPRRVMPPITDRHQRILDVGCGAGQTLIASNLPARVFAVGVDVDHSALALGKQLTETIRFVRAQGELLPFEDACFDFVICRIALPYMHLSNAVAEMSRVLKAEGDLWLVLHPCRMSLKELARSVAGLQLKAAVYRSWVVINGLTLHVLGKQWAWPGRNNRYESWQTNSGVKRALQAAGFEEIEIDRESHFVVTAVKKSDAAD